jgi:ATP-dependent helicase/nuclease subunit B
MSGPQLAAAVRELWTDLDAEQTLSDWNAQAEKLTPVVVAIHDTVWTQMNEWLDNLERAFRSQQVPVSEWLPILEAGLAGLSVGVIPPALDQVLVGTIDRSRNPDLKLAVILGMNETVFPAPPSRASILTDNERSTLADALESKGRTFGLTAKQRLAHERYFGYIACTRPRERLVLTCSVADSRGKALNPSPFLSRIKSMFPTLEERSFSVPDWRDAQHACELAAPLIDGQHPQLAPFATLPQFVDLVAKANQLSASSNANKLAREIVERLYANPLATSVSALEDFAACPFKFFVKSGLRAKEREEFEVDARQKGSFQHEILSEFHQRVHAQQKCWRDLTADEARALVREIGREKLSAFQSGLFASDEARRFTAEVLIQNLERLIETLIGWMAHYQFDPQAVELSFGLDDSDFPGWTIDLGNGRALLLRGRIDRIDLCRVDGADEALAVVIDYKSSGRKLDATKLVHGLELQLLSYLGWLRQLKPERAGFPVSKLEPAGVFYVALRGQRKSAPSREDALDDGGATRRKGFQHSGRFNKEWTLSSTARSVRSNSCFTRGVRTPFRAKLLVRCLPVLRST